MCVHYRIGRIGYMKYTFGSVDESLSHCVGLQQRLLSYQHTKDYPTWLSPSLNSMRRYRHLNGCWHLRKRLRPLQHVGGWHIRNRWIDGRCVADSWKFALAKHDTIKLRSMMDEMIPMIIWLHVRSCGCHNRRMSGYMLLYTHWMRCRNSGMY